MKRQSAVGVLQVGEDAVLETIASKITDKIAQFYAVSNLKIMIYFYFLLQDRILFSASNFTL